MGILQVPLPPQIAANRTNALKCTGPRSEPGKAASRFNALKHGLDAESLMLPGEDPAEYQALSDGWRTLLADTPATRLLTRIQRQLAAPTAPGTAPCANFAACAKRPITEERALDALLAVPPPPSHLVSFRYQPPAQSGRAPDAPPALPGSQL